MLGDVAWGRRVSLAGPVRKKLLKVKRERVTVQPVPSAGRVFRASSIGYLCPRAMAMALNREVRMVETFDADTCWRFAIGRTVHKALQNEMLPLIGDEFQGWWRCEECGHDHVGPPVDGPMRNLWIPQPPKCDGCGHDEVGYREIYFHNREYCITGHTDGVLVWGPDMGLPTEVGDVKTVDINAFRYRDPKRGGTPMREHIEQLHIYMWNLELSQGRLIYVPKRNEFEIFSAMVEFVVERDEVLIDNIKDMLLDAVDVFSEIERVGESKRLPQRPWFCTSRRCDRAKNCSERRQCWG